MTVYKPIKPLADNAATLAVAVVNGEDPAESDVINGTENNGNADVPSAITDTVPVFKDNVNDTIVADGYWTRRRHLHEAVRAGLQGRRNPVSDKQIA